MKAEKLIPKKEKLNIKHFEGLYFKEDEENRLVGYTQVIEHNKGQSVQLGYTWIEEEHNKRALKHQLWTKLIEKIKAPHIYATCSKDEKENYLSYGFTELKKIPEFLKNQKPSNQKTSYLIYKIQKTSKKDTSFSQIPDLIIIDGGKGQLGVVQDIILKSGLDIPAIGLAKSEEEIFMQTEGEDGHLRLLRIILPKNSQALYLVQRIRDESHRFANELRKKLGKKKLTESEIDDIPGIGLIIKRRLLKEYGSIKAIKAASMKDLEKTVGTYIAKILKEKLGDNSE